MKKHLNIMIIISLLAIVLLFLLYRTAYNEPCCPIPDRISTTASVLVFLKTTLGIHYVKYGKLPDNLGSLYVREGYNNSIEDGWGEDIIYEKLSNGNVRLVSYGRDKKEGGVGEDEDYESVFDPNIEGTNYIISNIECRIALYYEKYQKFPSSLEELPYVKKLGNRVTDTWGKPLLYKVISDEEVLFESVGSYGLGPDKTVKSSLNRECLSIFKMPGHNFWEDEDVIIYLKE